MLTYKDLLQLERQYRETRVLSVYLPKAEEDPALRDVSQTRLHTELSRVRHHLEGAPRAERLAFASASAALNDALGTLTVGGASVMAFAAEQGVLFADRVLAPVPFHVSWQDGLVTSPYVRSLKQEHPVLVVAVDSRTARLFKYQGGNVALVEAFEAHVRNEPAMHMGDSRDRTSIPVSGAPRGATRRSVVKRWRWNAC